jgi:hypothetical protein
MTEALPKAFIKPLYQPDVSKILSSGTKAPHDIQPKGQRLVSKWTSIDSTNLDAACFDSDEKAILIRFKNGAVYKYDNCSAALYEGLLEAKSAGQYFQGHIATHRVTRLR